MRVLAFRKRLIELALRKELEIYEKIRKDIVWSNNRCYDMWDSFVC